MLKPGSQSGKLDPQQITEDIYERRISVIQEALLTGEWELQHRLLVAAQGQYLDATPCNCNGMLELGGELSVTGHDSPSIALGRDPSGSLVDHRLYGKDHAFAQLQTRSRSPVIQHLRFLVHFATDAMPAIFAYNRATVLFGMPFDCEADIAKMGTGSHLLYPFPQRPLGNPDKPLSGERGIADQVGLARIRDETILFQSDVEVDDVSVADDFTRIRYTVADDMVDRAVQDIFEAILPLAGRACSEVNRNESVDQIIHLQCRHANKLLLIQHLEDGRQQSAGHTHECQLIRGFHHIRRPLHRQNAHVPLPIPSSQCH